jgi:hypothetical protein
VLRESRSPKRLWAITETNFINPLNNEVLDYASCASGQAETVGKLWVFKRRTSLGWD